MLAVALLLRRWQFSPLVLIIDTSLSLTTAAERLTISIRGSAFSAMRSMAKAASISFSGDVCMISAE
ncbi:hypothetical protein D3C73_1503060 [compost metagenome]